VHYDEALQCIAVVLEGWYQDLYSDWILDETFLQKLLESMCHIQNLSSHEHHILQ
jgi:hypothetical protein